MAGRKRVLLICHEYPPFGGGSGIVAEQLVDGLKSQVDLTVATQSGCKEYIPDNIPIKTYFSLRAVWPLCMLFRLLISKLHEFDAILVNDTYAIFVIGLFFGKRTHNKTTIILHGGEHGQFITKPAFFAALTMFSPRYTRLLKKCHAIITVSHMLRKEVLHQDPSLNKKIRVVYSGVPRELFRPVSGRRVRDEYHLEDKDLVLLSVSRIAVDKGYQEKLNIFAKLVAIHRDLKWMIVGDGPYRESLHRQVTERGLISNVIFARFVPRNNLAYYYSSANVFWLLSPRESFGLVYAEAIQCGIFTIGRNISGVNEVIKEPYGCLVNGEEECINAILATIKNEKIREPGPIDVRFDEASHIRGVISALF